ncbi:MAG: hypothetical protein U0U09_04535 [Cyclobacteriaceae bacterium]|jgi:DNA-directed RNA polymerase specialized sigma24 family protein
MSNRTQKLNKQNENTVRLKADRQQLLDQQDWETIIKQLTIHAHFRLKFWKLLSNRVLKGYSAKDIALEAVVSVYSGEWKWDSEKSDLLTYMKFHVVNGLVANLARNKEVNSTLPASDEFDMPDSFSIEEKINADMVYNLMEKAIGDDAIAREVFTCLYSGMGRKDVCQHLTISLGDFDNAIRRLRTKFNTLNIMYVHKQTL